MVSSYTLSTITPEAKIVSLVEQHRLPGPVQTCAIGWDSEPLRNHAELFRRSQQPLQIPDRLLHFDAAAVDSLEHRIQIAGQYLLLSPARLFTASSYSPGVPNRI